MAASRARLSEQETRLVDGPVGSTGKIRNQVAVEKRKHLGDDPSIIGQRNRDEGLLAEENESNRATRLPLQDVLDLVSGACEARRGHIPGFHGGRHIQGDDQRLDRLRRGGWLPLPGRSGQGQTGRDPTNDESRSGPARRAPIALEHEVSEQVRVDGGAPGTRPLWALQDASDDPRNGQKCQQPQRSKEMKVAPHHRVTFPPIGRLGPSRPSGRRAAMARARLRTRAVPSGQTKSSLEGRM